MNILGINCYGHDTAAAVLSDGRIAHLHEEERFNRQKHTRDFPRRCLEFLLANQTGGAAGFDAVAYPFRTDDEELQAIERVARETSPGRDGWLRWAREHFLDLRRKARIAEEEFGLRAPSFMVGHHESHMASSFFSSPFDRAAILSIDGVGDLVTTMFGYGEGTRLHILQTMLHPHGIGYMYTAMTQYLGFLPTCDEGKVMGLAPYGRPTFRGAFERLLTLEPRGEIRLDLDYFWHHASPMDINPRMAELIGPPRAKSDPIEARHEDIAWAVQERTEQAYFHHLRHLFDLTGCENLCLAGGVALNSCANGQIRAHTPFRNLFIPPFVHDAGTALGAAQWVHHNEKGNPRRTHRNLAYLGWEGVGDRVEKAIRESYVPYRRVENPCREAAKRLADGEIVGWFQRRTEAGPRALGNRSILADARRPEMKDKLNAWVKHRESFRPFAPAVLEERANEYFETDVSEPFMLQVFLVRPDKRAAIPSVTHVDGTGRLQTVSESDNPLFYNLIWEFDRLTGVPVVLNTSFNVMGEPIVNRPEEALRCFISTGIDVLFLDDFMVMKKP